MEHSIKTENNINPGSGGISGNSVGTGSSGNAETLRDKHYKALEFDKIRERLATYVACPDAKEMALTLTPADNLYDAEHLLQETLDAHMLLAKFGGPSFGGLENVNNLLHVASTGGVLAMAELLAVGGTLRAIRSLDDWYASCEGVETALTGHFQVLCPQRYLEDRIFSCILSADRMADDASSELKDIRRKLHRQEERIRQQLDRIIHSGHYAVALQDAIVTMRNGRYVVPVKKEYKSQVAGLVQDTSDSGATVFIEPMSVVEANNEIKELLGKEKEEIEKILADLSEQAGAVYQETKVSYESALYLNLVFSKAQLAYAMKASAPELNDQGIIDLKGARHPLIDPAKVVKTNIRLGEEFDSLIITGPNTGGKTVSIKTLGLLSLMAASGLMLPTGDHSKMAVFQQVFADIGDEQSIEQSLSTFSSHMKNIVAILEKADRHSLVLIDELGAGTDPVEGAALAKAILEQLHAQGAKLAATTHYAELKEYALTTPGVENASCEFDLATLSPTYHLIIGTPGRSNAFAISEHLGIPQKVVDRARELVSDENSQFEDVVQKLEESRSALEAEREEVRKLQKEAKAAEEKAIATKDSIEKLKEQEVSKARADAERIVERASREAAFFLNDLDKLKKQQSSADLGKLKAEAKRTIRKHEATLDDITNPIVALAEDEDYVLPRPLVLGDRVVVADLAEPAEVTALPDKKGMVEVTAGLIRTRVPLSRLRLDESGAAKKAREQQRPRQRSNRQSKFENRGTVSATTTCDLRGMTQDEALLTLDRFIDLQVRCGIEQFTIIHGKGTGVLRKAVGKYLDAHPQVKSHRLGSYGEGQDGVTIAQLK